jgi:hypothetical protein
MLMLTINLTSALDGCALAIGCAVLGDAHSPLRAT